MQKRPRLRAAVRGTFLAMLVLAVAVGIVASSKTFQVCLHDAVVPAGGPRLADRLEAALQLAGVYRDCTSEFEYGRTSMPSRRPRRRAGIFDHRPVVVGAAAVAAGADHLAFAQETTRDAVVAIRQSLSSMERAFVFVDSLQSAPGSARIPSARSISRPCGRMPERRAPYAHATIPAGPP